MGLPSYQLPGDLARDWEKIFRARGYLVHRLPPPDYEAMRAANPSAPTKSPRGEMGFELEKDGAKVTCLYFPPRVPPEHLSDHTAVLVICTFGATKLRQIFGDMEEILVMSGARKL